MSDETRDDETRDDNELTRNNDGDMPGDGEAMAAGSEDQPAGEGRAGKSSPYRPCRFRRWRRRRRR